MGFTIILIMFIVIQIVFFKGYIDINQYRKAIFLFVCIPTRLVLIYLIFKNDWVVAPAAISAIFLYKYLTFKKTDVGAFGGNVHWNDMRLFHAGMFGLYTLAKLYQRSYGGGEYLDNAWVILIVDLALGAFTSSTWTEKIDMAALTKQV